MSFRSSHTWRYYRQLLFSLSLPIELLCRSRKKHIAATVEGGFDGVLDDTDDEADSYRLHGDIIVDVHVVAKYR